ncbi:hypothetical protein JCM16303_007158 [Sporobolomyces ruberrimus]
MWFTTLPPELQEEILLTTDRATLAAICLVSKLMATLARPFLHDSLQLELSSWSALGQRRRINKNNTLVTEAREGPPSLDDIAEQYQLSIERLDFALYDFAFYEVLESSPEYVRFVKSLRIYIDLAYSQSLKRPQIAKFFSLLSSVQNLEVCSRSGEVIPATTRQFLLDHFPRTLTSLELSISSLPISFARELLEKVPLLESLTLYNVSTITIDASPSPCSLSDLSPCPLRRLRHLLILSSFDNQSFFSFLVQSMPSLVSLAAEFSKLVALDPSLLSTLEHVEIWGVYDTQDCVRDVGSTLGTFLGGCTSLKSLSISTRRPIGIWEDDIALWDLEFLSHLPRTLESLTFQKLTFDPTSLSDFLTSEGPLPRRLSLSLFSLELLTLEEACLAEEEMGNLCKEREIELIWLGTRQEDEGSLDSDETDREALDS